METWYLWHSVFIIAKYLEWSWNTTGIFCREILILQGRSKVLGFFQGVEHLEELEVLDVSNNAIETISPCNGLKTLKDLWLNDDNIQDFESFLDDLRHHRESLTCLYLNNNPAFRNIQDLTKIIQNVMPSLEQLDSTILAWYHMKSVSLKCCPSFNMTNAVIRNNLGVNSFNMAICCGVFPFKMNWMEWKRNFGLGNKITSSVHVKLIVIQSFISDYQSASFKFDFDDSW